MTMTRDEDGTQKSQQAASLPTHTWRELLHCLGKAEQQRLMEAVGVRQKTFSRWINGATDLPYPTHLKSLLNALPEEMQPRFLDALRQEPQFAKYADTLHLETRHIDAQHALQEAHQCIERSTHAVEHAIAERIHHLLGTPLAQLTADIEEAHVREHAMQRLRIIKILSLLALLHDMKLLTNEEYEELQQYLKSAVTTTTTIRL